MVRVTALRAIAVAAVAVLVAAAGYAIGRDAPIAPAGPDRTAREALPPVSLNRLDGEVESLASYVGRTVVINVWATWCVPCRRELPSLQILSSRLDPKRFAVIGLSIDKEPRLVRDYLADTGIDFPNYIDASQAVTKEILDVPALPTTIIVGPDGRIHQRIVGERRWDDPSVIRKLEHLAAGRAG